jgi:hypothetical protein
LLFVTGEINKLGEMSENQPARIPKLAVCSSVKSCLPRSH